MDEVCACLLVAASLDLWSGRGSHLCCPISNSLMVQCFYYSCRPNNSHMIRMAQTFLIQVAALNSVSVKPMASNLLHKMWCKLFHHWNKNDRHQIYFVRTDILDAYGSLHHEKLCDILKHNISAGNTFSVCCYIFSVYYKTFRLVLVRDPM
jgi:hypothetical protein